VYWNMLAPRRRPAALAGGVRELESMAAELHARDRAWFYQWLRVDEVVEGAGAPRAAGPGATVARVPASGTAPGTPAP
jgi:hypothetical protein